MNSKYYAWGAVASVVALGVAARFATGRIYGEAMATDLIGTLANSGLYLGSAVVAGSATMLALILTVIGLTNNSDSDFDIHVYRRIYHVAKLATVSLVLGVLLLLCLTMPISELDGVPSGWFSILYDLLFALIIGCCSLVIATAILLFTVIRRVVANITPLDGV